MIKNKYILEVFFGLFSLLLIKNEFFLKSQAKISTKFESENFFNEYFIEIVNVIKEAYQTKTISIKNNQLKKYREQGLWKGGLSVVYSKLCKKKIQLAFFNF